MDSKSISDQIKFMFILEKNDLVIKETNKMISKTSMRAATPQQISDKFKKYSNSTSTLTPNKTAPKSKPYTNRPSNSKTPIKTSKKFSFNIQALQEALYLVEIGIRWFLVLILNVVAIWTKLQTKAKIII